MLKSLWCLKYTCTTQQSNYKLLHWIKKYIKLVRPSEVRLSALLCFFREWHPHKFKQLSYIAFFKFLQMLEISIPTKQYERCRTTWEPGVLSTNISAVFRTLPISYNLTFNTYSTWKPSGTVSCSCRVGRLMNGTRHPGPEPYKHNRNHVSDKRLQRCCK